MFTGYPGSQFVGGRQVGELAIPIQPIPCRPSPFGARDRLQWRTLRVLTARERLAEHVKLARLDLHAGAEITQQLVGREHQP